MQIEIIYHEVKRRVFRKKKTLLAFLATKHANEILRATELKGKIRYARQLPVNLHNFDWEE